MPYELEPSAESSDPGEPGGSKPDPAGGADGPSPEPEATDESTAEEADPVVRQRGEPCPSCGAALHEPGALVCLGCGWDQRALEQRATETAEDEVEAPSGPLVTARPNDRWLATAIAVAGLATVAIGLLMGAPSLFPPVGEGAPETIAWADRLGQLGRLPVVLGVWGACGIGAFFVLAWLEVRPLGDMRAVAARVLAAVCAARCAKWIALSSWPLVEFTVEAIAAAAIYFALVLSLFGLNPRRAGIVLAVTVGGYFLALIMSTLVMWAV